MRVVIFGATGMVGAGVLLECLDDPRIEGVLVVGRHGTGIRHPKVTEVIHADFFSYDSLRDRFARCDACFFCLGVTSVGMSEQDYHHLTYDLTLAAARAMVAVNPRMTFCYVSGLGTDSTEQGRAMWARVKGKTENALLGLGFKASYMVRPGFIQPRRGVRSKTAWYHAFYTALGPLYPVFRVLLPRYVTTTSDLGRAMLELAARGYERPIIEVADLNRLIART
ncbi:MAG TPA: NAD-dependent epimerase/dehydratase family protein [Gemmatimonadales bacterium]|nr:NAD-dependent epimerase/dehydratase family protein [Gemmatimonadales bacterium]